MTQRPLALVGAGLSASVGYPLWGKLLDVMESEVLARYPGIASMKSQPDQLWRAEEYKRLMSEGYLEFIKDTFGPKEKMYSEAIENLVRARFGHILTSNYDACLDEMHASVFPSAKRRVIRFEEHGPFRDFLHALGAPVDPEARAYVHLHGRYDHPDEIVLTESDYTTRYHRSDAASRKLFAIFATQRIVFVGFGLGDPDFMQLLRETKLVVGGGTPRHFAILARPTDGDDFVRRRLVEKFGIEPVFYEPSDNHAGLVDILRELAGAAPRENLPGAAVDPSDPNKGKFGGASERNGRRLSATVAPNERVTSWYDVKLRVDAVGGAPLEGSVDFHLHPTFPQTIRSRDARDGRATLDVIAWGAFTVGVETDQGNTRLELDLSTLEQAPVKFRIS